MEKSGARADFDDPSARIELERIPAEECGARPRVVIGMPELSAGKYGADVPKAMEREIPCAFGLHLPTGAVFGMAAHRVAERVDAPRDVHAEGKAEKSREEQAAPAGEKARYTETKSKTERQIPFLLPLEAFVFAQVWWIAILG